jgi:hypothetical protein
MPHTAAPYPAGPHTFTACGTVRASLASHIAVIEVCVLRLVLMHWHVICQHQMQLAHLHQRLCRAAHTRLGIRRLPWPLTGTTGTCLQPRICQESANMPTDVPDVSMHSQPVQGAAFG